MARKLLNKLNVKFEVIILCKMAKVIKQKGGY